jgi:hypothetical protein
VPVLGVAADQERCGSTRPPVLGLVGRLKVLGAFLEESARRSARWAADGRGSDRVGVVLGTVARSTLEARGVAGVTVPGRVEVMVRTCSLCNEAKLCLT